MVAEGGLGSQNRAKHCFEINEKNIPAGGSARNSMVTMAL